MKKNEIAKAILFAIGSAGLIMVAITAPNLIGVIRSGSRMRGLNPESVNKSFKRLKESKLISITEEGNKTVVRLTKQGKDRVLKFKLDELSIPSQRKWDGFWRFVIFDVPEKFKTNRNFFVEKLKDMGFVQLQRSVWVCPYKCEDQIDFLKEIIGIGKFIRLITARSLDMEGDLLFKFKLRR